MSEPLEHVHVGPTYGRSGGSGGEAVSSATERPTCVRGKKVRKARMFGLVDTPRPERPVRGSPRMFKAEWIERYFSRVRPWHVLALWVPIAAALLYQADAAGAA